MKRGNKDDKSATVKPYIPKRACKALTAETTSTAVHTSVAVHNELSASDSYSFTPQNIPRRTCKSRIAKNELDKQIKHTNAVCALQWHPTQENILASVSLDKRVHIWDCHNKTAKVKKTIQIHDEGVKDVKWNRQGTHLLTASFDKTTKLINVETGSSLCSFHHADLVTSVLFHPTQPHLFLSGTSSSGVYAWDIRQAKEIKHFKALFGQVQDMIFLPDDTTFLTSAEVVKRNSMDKSIMAWDFASTAVLSNQIYQEPFTCTSLKLHPSEKYFLAHSSAGYAVIFDSKSPWKMNKYKRYEGHKSAGYHVGFDITADAKIVYCGDTDGYVFAYDAHSSKLRETFHVFDSPCMDVQCHPKHDSMIACCSWAGAVALWD